MITVNIHERIPGRGPGVRADRRYRGVLGVEGRCRGDLPVLYDATRLHHHAEGRLYGPFRILEPLIQRVADHERRRTVGRARDGQRPGIADGGGGPLAPRLRRAGCGRCPADTRFRPGSP